MTGLHLITHGGIDGFSRTTVYLRCANNNGASTVAEEGCRVPHKVCSDLGGENLMLWRYMVEQHTSRSIVITTHNCEIVVGFNAMCYYPVL